jgi:hypothetical protein
LSGFRMVRLLNDRDWHKIESESRTRFGFRMPTVPDIWIQTSEYQTSQYQTSQYLNHWNLMVLVFRCPVFQWLLHYHLNNWQNDFLGYFGISDSNPLKARHLNYVQVSNFILTFESWTLLCGIQMLKLIIVRYFGFYHLNHRHFCSTFKCIQIKDR